MSLLAVAEQTLSDVEAAAVADAKGLLNYIDNVFVVDIEPALATLIKNALATLGSDALSALLGTALGNAPVSTPTPPATV